MTRLLQPTQQSEACTRPPQSIKIREGDAVGRERGRAALRWLREHGKEKEIKREKRRL